MTPLDYHRYANRLALYQLDLTVQEATWQGILLALEEAAWQDTLDHSSGLEAQWARWELARVRALQDRAQRDRGCVRVLASVYCPDEEETPA